MSYTRPATLSITSRPRFKIRKVFMPNFHWAEYRTYTVVVSGSSKTTSTNPVKGKDQLFEDQAGPST